MAGETGRARANCPVPGQEGAVKCPQVTEADTEQ